MGSRAVLVCNGSIDTKWLYSNISKTDFLIAVDGGANKLVKTSFAPRVIIGDMDSISRAALRKYRESELLRFPADKDKTDLELALDYCSKKGFSEAVILGAIGSRADMSLSNVLALAALPGKLGARVLHENQEIFVVPKASVLRGRPGEKVSFIPLGGEVKGLSISGFKYNLSGAALGFGAGKGVSNEFASAKARVSYRHGTLLCVHFREFR